MKTALPIRLPMLQYITLVTCQSALHMHALTFRRILILGCATQMPQNLEQISGLQQHNLPKVIFHHHVRSRLQTLCYLA